MIGHHIAHYRIEAELGRGGMGIVFRAFDVNLERTVALKLLPPSTIASQTDRARFFREAKAAAQLNHAHVCHVYEVGEDVLRPETGLPDPDAEPRPFIAMEFVDGDTLAQRIEHGPLGLDDAIRIASQVAAALGAAHAAGIVHRDVKSANVMLGNGSEAKVLDFGLATTSAATRLTVKGSTMGTVGYMSPEQARGEDADRRTDLWSLGMVLYEMIAGRLPFEAKYPTAALYAILNEAPEPLTAVRTGVPMELEAIVEKLLRKESGQRYQTAGDLIADLSHVARVWQTDTTRATGLQTSAAPPRKGGDESSEDAEHGYRKAIPAALVGLLVGCLLTFAVVRFLTPPSTVVNDVPIVVLMDTHAPRGVYDQETRDNSGTNADILNEILRDMPLVLAKEAVGSTWDREDQILREHPDLVVIHRSAFYHSMNLELDFGYPDQPHYDDYRAQRLYEYAQNKLGAFLSYIAQGRPSASFLIYSRGSPEGWSLEEYRADWVRNLHGRFPQLRDKVLTMNVPGGDSLGSWRDPETVRVLRESVATVLGID